MATWHRTLNDAVVAWHTERGAVHPRPPTSSRNKGINETMFYAFPPLLRPSPCTRAPSSYSFPAPRARRDPSMEIWSLTPLSLRGRARATHAARDLGVQRPRGAPNPDPGLLQPARQQKGLHNGGFEYMRLSEGIEGGIANFERTLDGFLAGLSHDQLAPALRAVKRQPPGGGPWSTWVLRDSVVIGGTTSVKSGAVSTTTFAEVSEGVRAALAVYTQALDDGRTEDVVATFCPDGVCDIPGMGTHSGHDALRQAYTKLGTEATATAPRPQHRHRDLVRRRGHRCQRCRLHPHG